MIREPSTASHSIDVPPCESFLDRSQTRGVRVRLRGVIEGCRCRVATPMVEDARNMRNFDFLVCQAQRKIVVLRAVVSAAEPTQRSQPPGIDYDEVPQIHAGQEQCWRPGRLKER